MVKPTSGGRGGGTAPPLTTSPRLGLKRWNDSLNICSESVSKNLMKNYQRCRYLQCLGVTTQRSSKK